MLQVRNTFLNIEDQYLPPTSKLAWAHSDRQLQTYFADVVDDIDPGADFEEPELERTTVTSTTRDEDVETIPLDTLSCSYEAVPLYSRRRSSYAPWSSYEDVVTTQANCSDQSAAVGVMKQMKEQLRQWESESKHAQISNRFLLDAATEFPPRHADRLSLNYRGHRRAGGEEPARAGPQGLAISSAGHVMRTMPMQGAPVADQGYEQNATQPWMPVSEGRTTVMLRNLPNDYSSIMLAEMLHSQGFSGKYNFSYLPMDFSTGACLGYAFINMIESDDVPCFWQTFDGFSDPNAPSKKKWFLTWSFPHQGLQANVERYRNSPVMHKSVPQEFKPRLFANGKEIPFPLPTKKMIRRPRLLR